jgi:DNA invertase Pin-like site-specific DNA recombinase
MRQAVRRDGIRHRTDRPKLAKALEQTRKGDVPVIWRLDRLARSLWHLIDIAVGVVAGSRH